MKPNRMKQKLKQQLNHWKGILGIAGFYLILAAVGRGCPIRLMTGIPCPGCGLSRAYLSLLHLDLAGAFAYHPMFWAVPLLILGCLWYDRRKSSWAMCLLILIAAGFMITYFWRLAAKDPALTSDLSSGLIYQAVSGLLHLVRLLINRGLS